MPRYRIRWLTAIVTIVMLIAATVAPPGSAAADCTIGAVGIGDDTYPTMGNGGYDVQHYELDLTLDVAQGTITAATVAIEALAIVDLCAFTLDFEGLTIDAVTVDGDAAPYARTGKELSITPAQPRRAGSVFTVAVRYHGTPVAAPLPGARGTVGATPIPAEPGMTGGADPDEAPVLRGGWFVGADEVFALGEPTGSRFWYPVNEHPADKATYTARYTVPDPYRVVANGSPGARTGQDGQGGQDGAATFVWASRDPIASYLVTFHAGRLETETLTTATGLPVRLSFAPTVPDDQRAVFRQLPAMVTYAESRFGPYPFESIGATVTGVPLGLALETQTLPIYGALRTSRDARVTSAELDHFERIVFHEVAHQWFGNAVSIQRWDDIWLNEGFATYAEVLWVEHTEGTAARDQLLVELERAVDQARLLEDGPVVIADPGPAQLFSAPVYAGGALTLHAVREEVGDATFFAILQAWSTGYRNGNGATADFIATAETVSGQQLHPLFAAWLFTPELPTLERGAGGPPALASSTIWRTGALPIHADRSCRWTVSADRGGVGSCGLAAQTARTRP